MKQTSLASRQHMSVTRRLLPIVFIAVNVMSCTTTVAEQAAVYFPPSSASGLSCFRWCGARYKSAHQARFECVRRCPDAVTVPRATCESLYRTAECADGQTEVQRVDTVGVIAGSAAVLIMLGLGWFVLIQKSSAAQEASDPER